MLTMEAMNSGFPFYRDYNDVRFSLCTSFLLSGSSDGIRTIGCGRDIRAISAYFRIYANTKNGPADYSPDNVPYHPEYVAPISLDGYKEGSFCMTLGYPGSTERYLSSYGIEEMMNGINQAMIDVRGSKTNGLETGRWIVVRIFVSSMLQNTMKVPIIGRIASEQTRPSSI